MNCGKTIVKYVAKPLRNQFGTTAIVGHSEEKLDAGALKTLNISPSFPRHFLNKSTLFENPLGPVNNAAEREESTFSLYFRISGPKSGLSIRIS